MSLAFDWYNSDLQVLIENYRTSVNNKVQQFSDRNVRTTKNIHTLKSDRVHVFCFLFLIDYTIYAYIWFS